MVGPSRLYDVSVVDTLPSLRSRMDDENSPPNPGDDARVLYVPLRPENHELVDPQHPELFTLAELRQAHRLFGDEEEMQHYLNSLEGKRLHGPEIVWSEGSLLMVAHVSDELRERIRRYLGLSEDEMTTRMDQLRRSQS